MASSVAVLCILLALAATVHAQEEEIDCFAGPGFVCGGTNVRTATIDDCCTHSAENTPSFVYMVPGLDGCISCPIIFGFNDTTFTGTEQGENHVVHLGFLSGGFNGIFMAIIALDRDTAGVNDVSLTTTSLTFFPGSGLLQPVSFTLRVDGVAQEFVETFSLSITRTSNLQGNVDNIIPVTTDTLEGNILDGDRISFMLSEDDYRENEGENQPFEVRVAKNQDVILANPVTFRITPLTADEALSRGIVSSLDASDPNSPNRANEADFDTTIITGVFPADEDLDIPLSDVLVPIPFVDDPTDEAEEQYFIVFLEIIGGTNLALLNNTLRNTSRCNIVDNDFVRIGFAQDVYQFVEPEFEMFFVNEVTLIIENGIESEQTFLVGITVNDPSGTRAATLLSDDPTENYDYRISGAGVTFSTLPFPAGSLRIGYNFFLNSDILPEGTESFLASSTPFEGSPIFQPPSRAGFAFSTTEIQIIDNDFMVGFELPKYTVNETAVSQEVCIVIINPPATEPLSFTLLLIYETRTDTAGEEDFTPIVGGFTSFLENTPSRRSCFDVSITDDDSLEDVESFSLTLELAIANSGVIIQPNVTEICILDDDVLTIGFVRNYTVTEGMDEMVEIELEVIGGDLETTVVVRVVTTNGNALAPGDYNSTDQLLTFNPGEISVSTSIAIADDDILEEDGEIFFIRAELVSAVDRSRVVINPDMTTTTINDDDGVVISFELNTYDVFENASVVNLNIILMGKTDREVVVTLSTKTGSASSVGEADYESRVVSLTFPPSPNTQQVMTVSVGIVDDNFLERDEFFMACLDSGTDGSVSITQDTVPIVIIDDDKVVIGFEREMYGVREQDGGLPVSVSVLEGILRRPVVVTLSTTDGTAIAGPDYSSVSGVTLTYDQDNTKFDITIPIINDNVGEPTEAFEVNVVTSEDPDKVVLDPAQATIVISDEDSIGTEVNDTIIGDPLFTVPILVPDEQLQALNLTKLSLCYEIHGRSDQWFNLVTDECVSVNAQYVAASSQLNIIDEIGIRAVDDGNECVNIRVKLDECSADVNGNSLNFTQRYSSQGINVRRFRNRVRISVPNCDELTLVMWVICETRKLEENVEAEMIKFVVMRGLNFGHRESHGLLGQFWNVPANVAKFSGQLKDGSEAVNMYVINITTDRQSRSYAGWFHPVTWDFGEGPCIYVGDRQAGPIHEVIDPRDGVIESIYKDYQVNDAFSEDGYVFSMFKEDRCADSSVPVPT